MKKLILLLTLVSMPAFAAGGGSVQLDPVDIDMNDKASLQRGAGLFVNYCLSCHSAAFMREIVFAAEERSVPTNAETERALIVAALRQSGGNKNQAARTLGIDRQRLYRKLEKYDLS